VTFLKNRRSKNIKISVKPDQSVHVSFPFYVSSNEVTKFVLKNTEWITAQQQKFKAKRNQVFEGTQIQTKFYTVNISAGTKNEARRTGSIVEIKVADFNTETSRNYIEYVLVQIYRFEAKKLLLPRLSELAQKHHFSFNKVTIRNNKRIWGSCSSKNNISLNLQMMKLPDELIDYILLHELVHTKIKDHGPKFWEKLNEITNGRAKLLAKQVRQYSTYTL
jgi:hypothetical protein